MTGFKGIHAARESQLLIRCKARGSPSIPRGHVEIFRCFSSRICIPGCFSCALGLEAWSLEACLFRPEREEVVVFQLSFHLRMTQASPNADRFSAFSFLLHPKEFYCITKVIFGQARLPVESIATYTQWMWVKTQLLFLG